MVRLTVGLALLALATSPVLAENPLARLGVIGASVSDGVGGADVPSLSSLLSVGIDRQGIVIDRANQHLGAAPLRTTQRGVSELREGDVTAVVAVDLFFWYGYRFPSQEERETKLAAGLASLGELECPIFVGRVPKLDARRIPPQNQPSEEQLARLNGAISDWAATRENVRVLPLDEIMVAFRSGEPVVLAGQEIVAEPSTLFQPDGIHLTTKGQSMLGLLVLDALHELPGVSDDERGKFVRELELLRTRAVNLDRLKRVAKPTLQALKHLSRQAENGPVEADRLKEVLVKKVRAEDVDAALQWLLDEQALTREGTQVTPLRGVEPVRR